jgi:hypothetical protein
MEAQNRAFPGKAKEAEVLSMTPKAEFFQFWHLKALHAWRCAQAATIPPVTVVPAAARAAPRRVSPFALLPGCSRVCIKRNYPTCLADALSLFKSTGGCVGDTVSLFKSMGGCIGGAFEGRLRFYFKARAGV